MATIYDSFLPPGKTTDIFDKCAARLKARQEARARGAAWVVGDAERLRKSASHGALTSAGRTVLSGAGGAGGAGGGLLDPPASLAHARTLRDSPDFQERWDATRSLGGFGSGICTDGADALSTTVFRRDGGLGLQLNAVQALQQVGSGARHVGATALAKTLVLRGPDSNPYMRMSAAGALATMAEPAKGAGAHALAKALVEDFDVFVRRNAATSLGELGGDAAGKLGAAALSKALKDDSDTNVRWRACEALGKLGPAALGCGSVALIHAVEKDSDMGVRLRAATGLGSMGISGGEEGAAALYKAYHNDPTRIVRESARAAMELLQDKCMAAMSGPDVHPYERGTAAWIVAEFREVADSSAVELLAKVAFDPDRYLRRRTVEALGKVAESASEIATATLRRVAAGDDDDYVQWQAATIMGITPKGDPQRLKAHRVEILERRKAANGGVAPEDEAWCRLIDEEAEAARKAKEEEEAKAAAAAAEAAALEDARKLAAQAEAEASASATQSLDDAKAAEASANAASVAASGHDEKDHLAAASAPDVVAVVTAAHDAALVAASAAKAAASAAEQVPEFARIAQEATGSEAASQASAQAMSLAATAAAEAATAAKAAAEAATAAKAAADLTAASKHESDTAMAATAAGMEHDTVGKVTPETKSDGTVSKQVEAAVDHQARADALLEAQGKIVMLGSREEQEGDGWQEDAESDFEWEGFGPAVDKNVKPTDPCPPIDERRVIGAFAMFSVFGKISSDIVPKALKILGHRSVDEGWVDEILQTNLMGRSELDEEDFLIFVTLYEERNWEYMKEQFCAADLDGSGLISAEELAVLLDTLGVTPATGVVPSLLNEVAGSRSAECNFAQYIRVHRIIRDRAGFTRREYKKLDEAFKRYARHFPAGDSKSSSKSEDVKKLNMTALKGCLAWLGFAAEDSVVQDVLCSEVNGAQEASFPEFLQIVRRYREDEGTRIFLAVEKADADSDGTIDVTELPNLISEVGYMISSRNAVHEAARRCNLQGKRELTFEDLCALLEQIRSREGFSQAELSEIDAAFDRHDPQDGKGELYGLQLERAIRWMGYTTTFEEVQEILEDFDVDNTGDIDKGEFRKILARYRTNEIGKVRQAFKDSMGQRTFTDEDLMELLLSLGHDMESPHRQTLRRSISSGVAPGDQIDMWRCLDMVSNYRSGVREELRNNFGFAAIEVDALRERFKEHDPDNTGYIASKRLVKLLTELIPGAVTSKATHARMRQIMSEVDDEKSGRIDFDDFMKLMRLVSDESSKEKMDKERAAVRAVKFQREELKEFRKVFKMYDADGNGRYDFDELKQMISILVPNVQSSQTSRELMSMMLEVDEEGKQALDFPEFLRLMKKILSSNWHGVAT